MSYKKEFLNRCICVDFETSGLNPNVAEIIEQGIAAYKNGKWEILLSQLHNCNNGIPPDSSAINNITMDLVKDEPLFNQRNFAKGFIDENESILISHNMPFDSGMVEKYLDPDYFAALRDNWFCTLKLVKQLYANEKDFLKFDLGYLRYKLELPVTVDADAHRAGFDSYLAGLLFEHILDKAESLGIINPNEEYLPQLQEWFAETIEYNSWPVGKYKGFEIKRIPTDHLEWAVNKMSEFDENSFWYNPELEAATLTVLYERKPHEFA